MIWLEGGVNIVEIAQIDRNGFINFSFTKPVSALGRLFSDVKTELETKIESEYLETKAFISISNIKANHSNNLREVTEPGSYVSPGFSGCNGFNFIFWWNKKNRKFEKKSN